MIRLPIDDFKSLRRFVEWRMRPTRDAPHATKSYQVCRLRIEENDTATGDWYYEVELDMAPDCNLTGIGEYWIAIYAPLSRYEPRDRFRGLEPPDYNAGDLLFYHYTRRFWKHHVAKRQVARRNPPGWHTPREIVAIDDFVGWVQQTHPVYKRERVTAIRLFGGRELELEGSGYVDNTRWDYWYPCTVPPDYRARNGVCFHEV